MVPEFSAQDQHSTQIWAFNYSHHALSSEFHNFGRLLLTTVEHPTHITTEHNRRPKFDAEWKGGDMYVLTLTDDPKPSVAAVMQ